MVKRGLTRLEFLEKMPAVICPFGNEDAVIEIGKKRVDKVPLFYCRYKTLDRRDNDGEILGPQFHYETCEKSFQRLYDHMRPILIEHGHMKQGD